MNRVAYILARYPCETFIEREIRALRARGVAVDIYALRVTGHAIESGLTSRAGIGLAETFIAMLWALARPLCLCNSVLTLVAEQWRHPGAFLRSLRNVITAAAFARRICLTSAAAVHAHFGGEPAAVARTIASLLTIPYTFSIHARDIFVENHTLDDRIRCARAVAACTQAGARHALDLLPREFHGRVHLVRHGLMPAEYPPPGANARGQTVLAVGRLVEKKGLPVLLQALKLLHDSGHGLDCTILGDGPERHSLECSIHALGLAASARLAGSVPPDAVAAHMARAAVLAVPSVIAPDGDRDGLPNVILEAAAARLPIVASDVGGIGEFIIDGHTGILVPPNDPPALAAAIRRLIDAPALRERLANAAARKVALEYDAVENAGNLIEKMAWFS